MISIGQSLESREGTDNMSGKFLILICVLVLCAIGDLNAQTNLNVQTNRTAETNTTMALEGVKLPFEYFDNGSVKSKLEADRAVISQDQKVITAESVKYTIMNEDNTTNTVLTTPKCIFNKIKGRGETDADVRLEREDIVMTGRGMEFDLRSGTVTLLNDVNVEIKQKLNIKKEKKE